MLGSPPPPPGTAGRAPPGPNPPLPARRPRSGGGGGLENGLLCHRPPCRATFFLPSSTGREELGGTLTQPHPRVGSAMGQVWVSSLGPTCRHPRFSLEFLGVVGVAPARTGLRVMGPHFTRALGIPQMSAGALSDTIMGAPIALKWGTGGCFRPTPAWRHPLVVSPAPPRGVDKTKREDSHAAPPLRNW